MQFNRFTHLNDTTAVQNSGILQFSKVRPQSLSNVIIPWSIKYMWSNAAHSLLILTSPNCSPIRRHFPVWCGGRCTAPGGVGLRTMSGRLRAASGRFQTAFSRTALWWCSSVQLNFFQPHAPIACGCYGHWLWPISSMADISVGDMVGADNHLWPIWWSPWIHPLLKISRFTLVLTLPINLYYYICFVILSTVWFYENKLSWSQLYSDKMYRYDVSRVHLGRGTSWIVSCTHSGRTVLYI